MTEQEFQDRIAAMSVLPFREDYETALFELYEAADIQQRAIFRTKKWVDVYSKKPWKNPTDYDRSDLTTEQRCRRALLTMSISGSGPDFRDDLCTIAYCYHNLALLGLKADDILNAIAAMSPSYNAQLMRDFVKRKPEDKSLEAFGLKIVQTPNGPKADWKG